MILSSLIVGVLVFYGGGKYGEAATILLTSPTSTYGEFRTNVNTSLTNLNTGSGVITSLNNSSSSTQSFATSSDTNIGLSIGTSAGVHTFTPYWIGTLASSRIVSSTYWGGKQDALGFTPLDIAGSNNMTAPLVVGGSATSTISGTATSTIGSALIINGNVGIGTSTPTYKFDVAGTGRFTGALTLDTPLTNSNIASSTDWTTAYTDRLKWDGGSTGLTAATGRTSLGLGSMALLANTGSTTITTLGTIATGVWSGTSILNAKIASSTDYLADTKWTGVSTDLVAATGRTSLELGTIALKSSTDYLASTTPDHDYFIIENPTASEDDAFITFKATSTLTDVYAVNKTNGDTVTFNLIWDGSRSTASSSSKHAFASNTTITATTTPTVITSFASSTVNAGSVMRFITSAASSTQFNFTVYFTTP